MNDATDDPHAGSMTTPFQALQRAVDAADWTAATDAVRTGWYAIAADDADAARTLFERVPASVFRAHPLLAMEYGVLLNQLRFQRLRALRYFVTAVRAARSHKNSDLIPVDRLLIRSTESASFRLLGRTEMSVTAARAAMEQARALTDDERESITELARVFSVLAVSFYYGGLHAEALHAASLGVAETRSDDVRSGLSPLALLAGIQALRGDLETARLDVERVRAGSWSDEQRNGYSGIFYRVAEAVLAMEAFDTDRAREELEMLVARTRGRHTTEHWALIAEVDATIELVAGRPGYGLARLDEAIELRGGDGGSHRARARLARIRSLLHLALNNPDAAAATLRRDLSEGPVARIERARIALSLGQTGTALNELRGTSTEHLTTRQTAEAAAIDAAILLRISGTPRRASAIHRLGSLLERSGQRLPLMYLPAPDLARVVAELESSGFAHVVQGLPSRALLADAAPGEMLSKREIAVLEQLVHTSSIAQIASSQVVSANTVKSQLRSIYRKLEVSNREDAIAVALERHLLSRTD